MMHANKLKTFVWQGYDGQQAKISGEIKSPNARLAKVALQAQGVKVKWIRQSLFKWFAWHSKKRIKPEEITTLWQKLSILLRSGLPLLQAIQMLADSLENVALISVLHCIAKRIEQGESLSQSVGQEKTFDVLTCELIAVGEQSGQLETILNQIAMYREKAANLKQQFKKALWYPAMVLVIAMIVTIVLLIFVVPQFTAMFASFGAILPLPTRIVVSLGQVLKQTWWMWSGAIFIVSIIVVYMKNRYKKFAFFLEKVILKIPVWGALIQKFILTRITRTLAMTYMSGVPLLSSLEMIARMVNHQLFSENILAARHAVNRGEQLSVALGGLPYFHKRVIQMIEIGEATGKLDEMLNTTADFYEFEIDYFMNHLSQWLEPIMMLVLSIVIGGLMVAMYLPIFKLGTVI